MSSIAAFFKPKIEPILPFFEAVIRAASSFQVLFNAIFFATALGLGIPILLAVMLTGVFCIIYGCVLYYNSITAGKPVTDARLQPLEKKLEVLEESLKKLTPSNTPKIAADPVSEKRSTATQYTPYPKRNPPEPLRPVSPRPS